MSVLLSVVLFAVALPGESQYLAGCEAEREGKHGPAIAAFTQCMEGGGGLAFYARVRRAGCLGASGDTAKALAEYEAIVKGEPGPWVRMAQARWAALLASQESYTKSGALYQAVLSLEPEPWWAERYEARAAAVYLKSPEYHEAGLDYYRNVCATTRWRDPRLEAIEKLLASDKTADRFAAFLGLVRSAAVKDARKQIDLLSGRFEEAGVDIGAYKGLLDADASKVTAEQCAVLDELAKAAEKNEHARYLLAWFGRSFIAAENFGAAMAVVERMARHCGGMVETGDMLWYLAANMEEHASRQADAVAYYRKLAKVCPGHFRAGEALFNVAKIYRAKKDSEALVSALKSLVKEQPKSRYVPDAYYWLGGALEKAGRKKEAAAAYEQGAETGGVGNYYAHCALGRLAELQPGKYGDCERLKQAPFMRLFKGQRVEPWATPAEVAKEPRCARIAFFAEHGLEEAEWEALRFVDELKGGKDAAVYFQFLSDIGLAATALDYAKAWDWGITDGKRGAARLRVEYPRAYWPYMTKIAEQRGLDPYLLLSVARQESTFRPALTSWAGACGVMQVMPKTAEWLARKDPDAQAARKNLDHPRHSILLGSKYVRDMLVRSEGNLVFALASYNAGPGNCDKWRVRFPNATPESFIEQIPFDETRGYVKAVLANYAAYKTLYGN